jgi:NCAIR mutase (PurE)-related protein
MTLRRTINHNMRTYVIDSNRSVRRSVREVFTGSGCSTDRVIKAIRAADEAGSRG